MKKNFIPIGIVSFDEAISRMDTHMVFKGSAFATRQNNYLRSLKVLTKSERKAMAILRLFGTAELDDCTCCKKGKMKIIFGINKNRPPSKALLDKIKNKIGNHDK